MPHLALTTLNALLEIHTLGAEWLGLWVFQGCLVALGNLLLLCLGLTLRHQLAEPLVSLRVTANLCINTLFIFHTTVLAPSVFYYQRSIHSASGTTVKKCDSKVVMSDA